MPISNSAVPAPLPRNLLLRALAPADLRRLLPRLTPVEMPLTLRVVVPDRPVDALHFMESGTVSMICELEDGSRIEVGMVGNEGFVGMPLLLGADTSALEGLVQVEGEALRLPADRLQAALADTPGLLPLLLRYVDSFHLQVAQTAACNGRHGIEQRLARWLLMTHDRVEGDSFTMTQEFLSIMLGVRRPGVTVAIGALQRAGFVEHKRRSVQVLDRAGLEAACCECYAMAKRRFAWLDNVTAS